MYIRDDGRKKASRKSAIMITSLTLNETCHSFLYKFLFAN